MRSSTDQKRRAALAAYWLCQTDAKGNPVKQKDIPELMNEPSLSRSDVSKLVDKARSLGYLRTVNQLQIDDVEILDWVVARISLYPDLERMLCNRFGCLKRVIVVRAADSDPMTDDEAWDSSVTVFAENLAPMLLNLIKKAPSSTAARPSTGPQVAGLGWGRTLANVVAAISKLDAPTSENRNMHKLEVFPMWGSLYRLSVSISGGLPPEFRGASSSILASELHSSLCGCANQVLSIHGLPSILPEEWVKEKNFTMHRKRFLEDMSFFTSYGSIFGDSEGRGQKARTKDGLSHNALPLVHRMHTAIVTIGASDHPTRFYQRDSITHFFGHQKDSDPILSTIVDYLSFSIKQRGRLGKITQKACMQKEPPPLLCPCIRQVIY